MSEKEYLGAPKWAISQDQIQPSPKKPRKPRRTKAQMLADAEVRPDAVSAIAFPLAVVDAIGPTERRVSVCFRWFDIWIGAYVDTKSRTVYVCPLPMIVIAIRY